ncbi:MAG: hypothetical protein P8K68_03215 [Algibacter sp.]|uniref:hypothetical protein n=1 Tax=Algibacter sp. TaxID=1872428 RepID=UPI002624AF7B|nr:hypothetical protein [Algibacter sp.]MDG1728742.1 hypothetical protein [Algibacter sp.]MDG2177781.1 hypothetical protein [Algibacter sp.]
MKKVALILGFLVVSFGAFTQKESDLKRSDLQGPAYKNYKPWKHKTTPTLIYSNNKKASLTGPAYKNYKPWKDTSKVEAVVVNTSGHERQKLTGPAYKNYKPWIKKAK